MKKFLFILAALLFTSGAQAQKIKTMIVTGQDGSHWWKGGSEAIEMILENSGLFTVDILTTPATADSMDFYRPDFKKYDLVVINYGGATWSEPARKDFEQFVSGGGGAVVVHSSIVPMDDWTEYNKMIGLGAWNGRNEKDGPYVYWKDNRWVYDYSPGWAGYHGLQHPFTVVHRDTVHPILKGLPSVWDHFKDELYARLRGPAQNMKILATAYETAGDGVGRDEPVLWTVDYGKGKVFVNVLGHAGNDPELRYAMECTGFQ
ncbi:MAG: ThuA domain-containing protein, partial [Dysgonamonadaceae bacterium]|nr:ThuA domain-containing protein [Dysgonamonadaceae bacterium]